MQQATLAMDRLVLANGHLSGLEGPRDRWFCFLRRLQHIQTGEEFMRLFGFHRRRKTCLPPGLQEITGGES